MSPQVEAAWIALLGAALGIGGTVTVAIIGFRSTRRATKETTSAAVTSMRDQIEADRRNRLWEKQAETYTDAIAILQHRHIIRQGMMREMLTGIEPEEPDPPLNIKALNARLIAYGSPGVLDAIKAATDGTQDFQSKVTLYSAAREQARILAESGYPSPGTTSERDAATKAHIEAERLDDVLLDIRDELHAGTDRAPAPPVPQARPAPDHQGAAS